MASSRRTASLCSGAVLIGSLIAAPAETEKSESGISIAAAKKCELKLKKMEDFLEKRKPGGRNTTRFSEKEVNSYLAYNLSKEYHPSLKKLVTAFKKNQLQIAVSVDFDRIGATSNKLLPKIMGLLLSGTHTIDAQGKLVTSKGNGYFVLEQARFDNKVLPKAFVERVITAVGQKQNPPFDPLQPSKMPYEIKEVDMRQGYIIVYQ